MYKLTLCLKYLLKRALAYFALVGVTLCVFMMLVAVSVLNGFVDKIERAAKGLFGDIVVSSEGLGGIGYYDEFIGEVRRVEGVEAASPFILTFGILRFGPEFRRPVQIAGIRLPGRAAVSDFEEGLFVQAGVKTPTFDPPMDLVRRRLAEHQRFTESIQRREDSGTDEHGNLPVDKQVLRRRLKSALAFQEAACRYVRNAEQNRRELEGLRRMLRAAEDAGNDDEVARLEPMVAEAEKRALHEPKQRVILGLGIPGLSFRTDRGETVRVIGPGQKVVLSLIPLGRRLSPTDITPNTRTFTVIDDCSTDVASIDSEIVYLPFRSLQELNNMSVEHEEATNEVVEPARCSQIHIKVLPELSKGKKLREVTRRVQKVWLDFEGRHPRAAATTVHVETWRQRQIKLVSSIEAQRTLMVIILGIISTVAILLIFVIFYVIVVQKTRDIGVLKAVGASSGGVAAIFLSYGAAIGLVGSIVGTIAGGVFVHYINPIHDWVARTFGFEVWSRETFMFEKIPNEVGAGTVVAIVLGAITSGILGSLIPSILAARKQPVEALRYE